MRFEDAAREDLKETWRWIAGESGRRRADGQLNRIKTASRLLEGTPRMGRPLPEIGPEVRMLVVEDFRVVYRVEGSEVLVLRVIHSRRDFSKAWRGRDPDAHS